jgi:hypothetical protein
MLTKHYRQNYQPNHLTMERKALKLKTPKLVPGVNTNVLPGSPEIGSIIMNRFVRQYF